MPLRRFGLLVLAFVVIGLLSMCGGGDTIQVEGARARAGELRELVATNGVVEPIEHAEVRARLAGRIVYIPEPGTRVKKGQILLRIDEVPVASELAAARSERLAAQDSLRAAKDRLARVERRAETDRGLFKEQAMTSERFEEGQAELREARAQARFLESEVPLRVQSLDHHIQELEAQHEAAVVRAPFAGTLYRADFKKGETVEVGVPVIWFADLDRLRVRANVDQVDLGRVVPGQPVGIRSNAYPDRLWSARITELIPHVVQKKSRLVAEGLAEVMPPAEGLVPGMTVDVEVMVALVPEALQVPAEAVFTDERGAFVYRVQDDRIQKTRVQVGRSTIARIEILEGLQDQDSVVLGPVSGLRDGMRVEVRIQDGS